MNGHHTLVIHSTDEWKPWHFPCSIFHLHQNDSPFFPEDVVALAATDEEKLSKVFPAAEQVLANLGARKRNDAQVREGSSLETCRII